MKDYFFTFQELKGAGRYPISFDLDFEPEEFASHYSLKKIISGEGKIKCLSLNDDNIAFTIEVTGIAEVEDSYSLKLIDYHFTDSDDYSLNFLTDNDEDNIEANGINIKGYLIGLIFNAVPENYSRHKVLPSVSGVKIMKEDEYVKMKEETIDPRLASLLDIEIDEEE